MRLVFALVPGALEHSFVVLETISPKECTHKPLPSTLLLIFVCEHSLAVLQVEADRGEDLGIVHRSLRLSEYLHAQNEERKAKAAKIAENGGGGGAGDGSESKKKRNKSKKAEVSTLNGWRWGGGVKHSYRDPSGWRKLLLYVASG